MAVSFSSSGAMTANYDDELTVIGSAFPVMAASALPAAAADNAGQIIAITDFGYPNVLVQSSGSGGWKQLTHFFTTWAALPSATTFLGFVGYITDFFNGFRVIARAAAGSNYWRPLNPIKLISYEAGDPATTLGPDNPVVEYTLTGNIAIPAGLILAGDSIMLDSYINRGGTLVASSPILSIRIGTSGTPASNPAVGGLSITGTSNQINRAFSKYYIASATKTMSMSANSVGVASNNSGNLTRTITDITTPGQFVSLTIVSLGTAETMTPISAEAFLYPNA